MKTSRLFKWTIVPVLVIAMLFGYQALRPQPAPENNAAAYYGRGEYQRFEARENLRQSSGIGHLRRFEAQNIIPVTGISENNKATGMGELRLFEKNSQTPVGMGDLRRFEAVR